MRNNELIKKQLYHKIERTEDRLLLKMLFYILENWEDKNHIGKMSLDELRQLWTP
ncbi:hypothetical protein [Flagellimonas marinaquae]